MSKIMTLQVSKETYDYIFSEVERRGVSVETVISEIILGGLEKEEAKKSKK